MVKCPKCGFEQPEDVYCARCGVDIKNFQRPADHWLQRLRGSSTFYFFLLATVVGATVYFIFQNSKTPPLIATETYINVAPNTTTSTTLNEVTTTTLDQSLLTSTATTFVEASENTSDKPKKLMLNVYFIEIPVEDIMLLLSSESPSGIITNFQEKFTSARTQVRDLKLLSKLKKEISTTNTPLLFEQMATDAQGLAIRVVLSNQDDEQITATVTIESRGFGSSGLTGDQSQEFEAMFNLTNSTAGYFLDILPRPSAPREDPILVRHPIFRILTTPAYTASASEFLIIFEVQGLM